MIGAKVKIFVFRRVALFLEFGAWTRPQIFGVFSPRKPGWTQGEIHPGIRARVKGSLITFLATDIKHNFISRKIGVYSQI